MIQLDQNRFRKLVALNNASVPDVGQLDEEGFRPLPGIRGFLKYVEMGDAMVGELEHGPGKTVSIYRLEIS